MVVTTDSNEANAINLSSLTMEDAVNADRIQMVDVSDEDCYEDAFEPDDDVIEFDGDSDEDAFVGTGVVPEANEPNDDIAESDIELEGDIVDADDDPPQKMGDLSVIVTEEGCDASQMAKGKAMVAVSEGNLDEAIEHLTEAILLNPTSAIMYGTRATVYIKMKKPNAAIRDANAALEINPDSAKGYKARGMALAMLGRWEEAAKDLHIASRLDYDEEINSALKNVEPNAHKVVEHRRKYDRLRKEREEKKADCERQAEAAYEKAKNKEQPTSSTPRGMPENFDIGNFCNVIFAHTDPEISAKLQKDAESTNKPSSFTIPDAVQADIETRWAGNILEQSWILQGAKAIKDIQYAVSKLEGALKLAPKMPETLWWLGNAYTSYAVRTQDFEKMMMYFAKAEQYYREAVEEVPTNRLYLKSWELSRKAPELHSGFLEQVGRQSNVSGASSASNAKVKTTG